MIRLSILATSLFVVTGCVTQPSKIQVTESIYADQREKTAMRQCVAELNRKRTQAGLNMVEVVSTAQARDRSAVASEAAVAQTLSTAALRFLPMVPGLSQIPHAAYAATQLAGTATARATLANSPSDYADQAETAVAIQRCMARKS